MQMSYSIFKAPVLSFFSRSFYRDTAKQGHGMGFLYLLVILILCCPLSAASGYFHLLSTIDANEVSSLIRQWPDITVKNGVMTMNKPSPYRINFKNMVNGDDVVIIFDTSGKTTTTDEAKILVTDKGILFDGANGLIPWKGISDFDLAAANLRDTLKQVALACLAVSVVLIPLTWLGHIIVALIYGLVALILDRHKLGFATAVRMAVVAMTPTMMLTTLFYLLFCTPILWPLITVPISIAYLYFGYSSLDSPAGGEVSPSR